MATTTVTPLVGHQDAAALITTLLTMPQVARHLNVSERTIWSLIHSGHLPCVRIGRTVRVDPTDLVRFILEAKLEPTCR